MTTSISECNRRRMSFLIPILVCLGINSAIFAGIAINNAEYLRDFRLNGNPDAVHYVLLGRNTLLHGNYSRSEQAPYVPDMLRTPIYPLFSGALDIIGKPLAIYLAQVLLQLVSCALVYRLAVEYFGVLAAFFASLFLATDAMWAVSNFEALSEPLFVFLMLFSTERLAGGLFSEPRVRARLTLISEAGVLLGLAILTRPVALYALACYVPIVFISAPRALRPTTRLFEVAILMATSLILPGAWIARNYATFSVARLTNVDLNNLVYFVGAGAYQVERGLDLKRAHQVIAEEFGLLPYSVVQNSHLTDIPMTNLVAEMQDAWPRVMLRYPQSLCIASALAIIKSIGSHNVPKLADMTGLAWIAPRTGELIRLRTAAFTRLWRNGALLTSVLVWQLAHSLLAFGLAAVGVILVLKSPDLRPVGSLCLACFFYYVLTIPLFGFDAYYRCRFPMLPYLYMLAGVGSGRLVQMLESRSTRQCHVPPA
jgi:4-amino-4-deoxy-L-arabinose transferase-like glycosyltransferase